MSASRTKISLQFPSLHHVAEYTLQIELAPCELDSRPLVIVCELTDADIELAIHGYGAIDISHHNVEVTKTPIKNILLIDDDIDDCTIFESALKEISSIIKFASLNACKDILLYLDDCSTDLIFLDINLPKVDGFNCLKELQNSAKHCRIPIVMYSSSNNPKEINAAYGFGASLYFKKPTGYNDMVDSLSSILLMDWNKPETIQQKYYVDGKFKTFALEK